MCRYGLCQGDTDSDTNCYANGNIRRINSRSCYGFHYFELQGQVLLHLAHLLCSNLYCSIKNLELEQFSNRINNRNRWDHRQ